MLTTDTFVSLTKLLAHLPMHKNLLFVRLPSLSLQSAPPQEWVVYCELFLLHTKPLVLEGPELFRPQRPLSHFWFTMLICTLTLYHLVISSVPFWCGTVRLQSIDLGFLGQTVDIWIPAPCGPDIFFFTKLLNLSNLQILYLENGHFAICKGGDDFTSWGVWLDKHRAQQVVSRGTPTGLKGVPWGAALPLLQLRALSKPNSSSNLQAFHLLRFYCIHIVCSLESQVLYYNSPPWSVTGTQT